MNNPYLNSNYSNNYSNNTFLPQIKVPVVNGREGANAYRMGIDSQVILLDISGKLIWIVSTDSAGYKTIQPYDIMPHVEPEPPDYNVLMNKINRMEETLNGFISAINNSGSTKSIESNNSQSITNNASSNGNTSIDLSKQF